jgi:cytochrome c oxidase assembly protein subunit 17
MDNLNTNNINNLENIKLDVSDLNKKKLKPCCACPDTKKLRDQCLRENGEENCLKFIDDHKKCMIEQGFII